MANPPEIFVAKVSLRSKMHLLSKIKDRAPIVNEQSVEIDEQAGVIDDHDPAAPTDSSNLLEDVDLLFKEVIDVRQDLVGRVDELRIKLVQTLTSNDNDEMEHAMDVDNEDGKYCLDAMSIGFEEDKSNREIKVNLYQQDRNHLCDKMEVVVEENTPVIETSTVIKTIVVDSTLKFDVEEEENLESTEYDCKAMPPFTEHIELWVELLWRFRAPDVDWALAGPHFCPAIIGDGMPVYISKAKGRSVSWIDVDKVYFPLNEPELHWALAELHLCTGVIIIYDSMTPRKRNKNSPIVENIKWWINMRETMSKQLSLFLDKIRVLKRKGLQLEEYQITFSFEEKVPHQGSVYGDYEVWVCLLLYILTRKLPLVFGDPIQVALAYCECMLAYYWKYKASFHLPEYESS
nr:phospholipase-like protein [Tanacetum cinerariifolium]